MRLVPFTALPTVALLALTLAGCSGDDEPNEPEATSAASSDGNPEGGPGRQLPNRTCTTSVTVTGAATAEWTGPGDSRGSGPEAAVYSSENEANRLTVYSGGGDAKPAVNVTVGDQSFGTLAGEISDLGAARNGTKAAIDVAVPASQGDGTVNVVAEFACK